MGWFRAIRTQSERRLVAAAGIEGVRVRAKRNSRRLPTAYDDRAVAAHKEVPKKLQK